MADLSPPIAVGALAVLVALAIDHWAGEPPLRWHPVVWMGKALDWFGRRIAPRHTTGRDLTSFWLAALVWCGLAAIVLIVFWVLQAAVLSLPIGPLGVQGVLLGVLLKPLLAWRMLRGEVQAVEAALGESLEAGRARLAWLVSRDVAHLTATQVRESAIESLAENLSDSVVAPLFWFAVAGLPGAALYRLANTADAMWGYPGLRGSGEGVRYWQWAGKWAARADDVLSWLPARTTGLLLALWAGGLSLCVLAHEARRTPSPNSGWPMAAMALALGVRLGKPEGYQLHSAGRSAIATDTLLACNLSSKVVLTLVGCALVAMIFIVM